jgi:cation-transporting ATPase 13A1
LRFAGFLVFHSPLKPDAQQCLRELADASHRVRLKSKPFDVYPSLTSLQCIMITGDNPLTAVHVATDVDIMDRDALILDLKENPAHEGDLEWRTVDESKAISVNPDEPLDQSLLDTYDICMTGAALKQFATRTAAWHILARHTWVYARVSPAQKEFIVRTLRELGYTTLMAGDGTNDVGALKQAHIGVALLDGTEEDLKRIAEHGRLERVKKVYQSQLNISARFNQPPPAPPPAIAHLFPDVVEAQKRVADDHAQARKRNPMEKFDMASITDALANMEGDDEAPKIKLGDASCAAPFTSKLSNVKASTSCVCASPDAC